jgi:hypothetical protein
MTRRPALLVTIDTENHNIWSRPRCVETRNAEVLPRFQARCERHALKPAYLVTWEMAQSPVLREFGRDVLARGASEIGMHSDAWNSSPERPLTKDDLAHLGEAFCWRYGLFVDAYTNPQGHRAFFDISDSGAILWSTI